MAFQPVTDAFQLVLHGYCDGDMDMVNTFGIHVAPGAVNTQGLADAEANLFSGNLLLDIAPYMSTTTGWTGVTLTDLRTEGAPEFQSTAGFPIVGTDATGKMPNEVALVISWRTAIRGRSYRGRSFWSGWGSDTSDGNTAKPVPVAALAEMAEDLIANTQFGVISRRHNGALRAAGVINDYVSSSVSPEWKSQRGRRPSN